MEKVFKTQSKTPSIILGDFNLYDEKETDFENSRINKIAHENGFVPMVNEGTTINGHLLDQIFISKGVNELKIEVLPSYYSDHHLIVLCFPAE